MAESYRQRCLDEKGGVCVVCGEGRDVVVHHKDGDRSNGDSENLAPVCPSCHKSIHRATDPDNPKVAELQEELAGDSGWVATGEGYKLDALEVAVLDALKAEGRVTTKFVERLTGYPKVDVNKTLRYLVRAGWVEKRTRGVYDLVEDPRDD